MQVCYTASYCFYLVLGTVLLLFQKVQYCYTPDYEKNKIAESFTYYVIPCKYYKTLGKRWNGCKYLGIITDDFVFDDQCKMCGKNYGDDAS